MVNTIEPFISVGLNGLLIGMIYGLAALGLSIVFGVMRIINFAHGEFLVLAGLLASWIATYTGISPWIVICIVPFLLMLMGYFLQYFFINSILEHPEHSQFIIMAGVAMILLNAQQIIFGTEARLFATPFSYNSLDLGFALVDGTKLLAGSVALVMTVVLFIFFKHSRHGIAIRACADNLWGARIVGLDVKQLFLWSTSLAFLCIGVAGISLNMVFEMTPQTAPQLTLLCFIIVILGRLKNMAAVLVSGIFIGLIEAFSAFLIQSSLKTLVSFVCLILFLILQPTQSKAIS